MMTQGAAREGRRGFYWSNESLDQVQIPECVHQAQATPLNLDVAEAKKRRFLSSYDEMPLVCLAKAG
jgi:hypothetical protein